MPRLRRKPEGIVEIGALKTDLGRGGIVALEKLRLVAGRARLMIGGVRVRQEGLVAGKHSLPVRLQIADQAVTLIAADPYAVDQPLIQRVNGDYVLARAQEGGHVERVVAVLEVIGRRGALPDEQAVDIHFIVIVGGDEQKRLFRRALQREAAAEEDMPVAMFVAGQIDRLELLVKDVAGREGGELAVGDPAACKDMGGFSFHGR